MCFKLTEDLPSLYSADLFRNMQWLVVAFLLVCEQRVPDRSISQEAFFEQIVINLGSFVKCSNVTSVCQKCGRSLLRQHFVLLQR